MKRYEYTYALASNLMEELNYLGQRGWQAKFKDEDGDVVMEREAGRDSSATKPPNPGANILSNNNILIHYYSMVTDRAPLCETGDLGEWVRYDHTAAGKICPDCTAILRGEE